jgi:hypothetical protein
MEIEANSGITLKCKPIFGADEMSAPVSAPKRRSFVPGRSIPVHIKLEFKDRMMPSEVLSSSPAGYVEFQASIHFGASVEFLIPKPTSWTPGRIYQMRGVKNQQPRSLGGPTVTSSNEAKIKMTMKYSTVRFTIPGIVVPRTAAARDLVSSWSEAVERNQVRDPNIVCLSKDPDAYDFQVEEGGLEDITEGMELFLIPTNKTGPEVMRVDVTWDGFDSVASP